MAGRVIKSSEMADRQLVRYNPDDALRNVQDKIEAANSQIRVERDRAAAEVQRIYDEAAQKGYETGFAKGTEEGRAKEESDYKQRIEQEVATRSESLKTALDEVVSKLDLARTDWLRQWEDSAVEIVCSIASRVARKVVAEDSFSVRRTLNEILSLVSHAPKVVAYLHPDDIESIQMPSNPIGPWAAKVRDLELVADPEMTRGGCRIETEHCSIDAQVETQIAKLLAEIIGEQTASTPPPSDAS